MQMKIYNEPDTLETLENNIWAAPATLPLSGLIKTCHALRKKPLQQFTIDDIRLMISQQIGLPFLIPMALTYLHENILAEGRYYPGDLLQTVLQTERSYWNDHPEQYQAFCTLFDRQSVILKACDCSWEIKSSWFKHYRVFSEYFLKT